MGWQLVSVPAARAREAPLVRTKRTLPAKGWLAGQALGSRSASEWEQPHPPRGCRFSCQTAPRVATATAPALGRCHDDYSNHGGSWSLTKGEALRSSRLRNSPPVDGLLQTQIE